MTLTAAAQPLPEVTVEAPSGGARLAGFEARRTEGFGHFLDEPLLRRSEHRRLADELRANVPGVRFLRR